MSGDIRTRLRGSVGPAWARSRRRFAPLARRLPGTSLLWGPPRRFAYDTEGWVAAHGAGAAPRFEPVHPRRNLVRSPPVGLDPGTDWRDMDGNSADRWGSTSTVVRTWPTWVASVPGGRVYGRNGAVVTDDDTLLADASCEFIADQRDHSARSRMWLGRPTQLSGPVAVIAANYGQVYYHWMMDVLPRLELLRLAGWGPDRLESTVVNEIISRQQVESLRACGVERWTSPDRGRLHVRAEQLVVPSVVGESGVPPPWACDFLRRTFLPSGTPEPGARHLLVSRADAATRRVRNEDDLVAALEPFGFEVVTLSGSTIADQASLFASARIVVAPHGGGLTNLVFAPGGTAVVEMFARSYVNPVFWHLANMVGLRYRCLVASPVPLGVRGGPATDDLRPDVGAVIRAVETALARPGVDGK